MPRARHDAWHGPDPLSPRRTHHARAEFTAPMSQLARGGVGERQVRHRERVHPCPCVSVGALAPGRVLHGVNRPECESYGQYQKQERDAHAGRIAGRTRDAGAGWRRHQFRNVLHHVLRESFNAVTRQRIPRVPRADVLEC